MAFSLRLVKTLLAAAFLVSSCDAQGAASYTYDSLNRLATVVDNGLPAGHNTTTYSYDAAGNLVTATYPNGVQSSFTYDNLNRVTAMNAGNASYNYALGPTGSRQSAVESSGRTLNWSYDGINRLTNETINLDPHSNNGAVAYGRDPVGNRQTQTSSIPGIPNGSFTFDANDRASTETYDANGNTLTSGGKTFAYDFQDRLKAMYSGSVVVTLQYDGDGNRVAKTVNGVTTSYLVDDVNPTGYPQVVAETVNGVAQRTYTYGLQLISQNQLIGGVWMPSFFIYDGSGNVRMLTDATGKVTDTYDYDAFGNTIHATGSTPNVYLYRGEQYDPDLGLYYLRARYFNPATGRFLTRDPDAGRIRAPATLHKYLYASGDPVNKVDPTGKDTIEYTEGLEVAFKDHGLAHLIDGGLEISQGNVEAFIEADVRKLLVEWAGAVARGVPFDVEFLLNGVPWAYRVFILTDFYLEIPTYFKIIR